MIEKPEHDEFFIGYAPPMPPRLARFICRVVIGAGALVLIGAGVIAAGHVPLEGGTFEFGRPRRFEGTIVERPYPTVRLSDEYAAAAPMPLLVAPGKHGADALVRGLNGRQVAFMGTLIQRGPHTMIEIEPTSLEPSVSAEHSANDVVELREEFSGNPVELTGEIVDPKCFLGVMVPGAGKTHKDCASLCLRGGIPPVLHVEDRTGRSALLLLIGLNGKLVGEAALQAAGEAVSVTGLVQHMEGWLVLRTDPASWRARGALAARGETVN